MKRATVVCALALVACVKDKDPPKAADAGAPPAVVAAPEPSPPTVTAAVGTPGQTRAAVYTRLEKDGAGTCANPGTVLAFGDFQDEEKPKSVAQGESVDGKPVSIACKVAPNGPGFAIEAKLSLPGVGELVVTSAVDGEGRSRAANVALSRPSDGTWTSNMCELEPSMLRSGGVKAGHYVASIKCREVVNRTARQAAPMAGTLLLDGCALK